ncbi:MAG: O-antigen ligase family protein, partial [Cyanobacteria bacterium P01_A01_bin.45]
MALFILIGAFFYEYRYRGGIQLKKPTLSVLFLLIFSSYNLIGLNFYRLATTGNLEVTADLRFLTFWYGLTFLLWYIQSYKIKVRLPVVAWSVSILVVEMLAFWIIGELIFGSRDYTPVRTIFSIFAGNADGGYEPGKGLANYLIPYRPNDVSIAQFSRWSFFFIIPEVLALVTGYIILLALDIRNSFWSGLLMSSSFFLLLISGTRSVWLVVPILIFLRFIFNKGFQQGLTALLAVIALTSWITLSFPVVTESLFEAYESQIVNVENYRADSTEVRNDIYQETLKAIPEKPIFGHWVAGSAVLKGFELGRVGTHSFILGTLAYRLGLVGTLIFLSFWISLCIWFYKTRENRPSSGYFLLALFSLVSTVMEFGEMIGCMFHMAEQLADRLAEVVRQRNELGTILSSMDEGVVAVDSELRVISLNRSAATLLKLDPAQV